MLLVCFCLDTLTDNCQTRHTPTISSFMFISRSATGYSIGLCKTNIFSFIYCTCYLLGVGAHRALWQPVRRGRPRRVCAGPARRGLRSSSWRVLHITAARVATCAAGLVFVIASGLRAAGLALVVAPGLCVEACASQLSTSGSSMSGSALVATS